MPEYEYFIDGTMQFLQVGHARFQEEKKLFSILVGEVVASRGKLSGEEFRIDGTEHSLVLAYPKELQLGKEDEEAVRDFFQSSGILGMGKGVHVKCVPYPVEHTPDESTNTKGSAIRKNAYAQAKDAILNAMRAAERNLLDQVLQKKENSRIYVDGEFQIENPFYQGRVISICKQMSLASLIDSLTDGEKLVSEIAAITEIQPCTSIYQWKDSCDKPYKRHWWTWYLKLRENILTDRDQIMSDIIQCTVESEKRPSGEEQRQWNGHLQRLAFPTCYGLDKKRWRTHIYQIYLTEEFCKTQLLNIKSLEHLTYGKR